MELQCSKCKQFKPTSEFYPCPQVKRGWNYYCKSCAREFAIANHRKQDPERKRKDHRRVHLKALYGITPEQVAELEKQQNGLCAICQKQKPLVVDHNHETNKVRGLLCVTCNFALGGFCESVPFLAAAAVYLMEHNL
jgi:hypothetical protein